MGIDNIRHPIKDTVKADNSTYSSNKIESLIHSATELPETSIVDAGDVLMVNDEGEWDKGEIIIPQEVPTPAVADSGKVISVNSSGEYELATPAPAFKSFLIKKTGTSYYFNDTAISGSDIGNIFANGIALLIPTTMGNMFLYGEKFEIDMVIGGPVARFSNIFNDGTHTYYKYIDVPASATAPITGLTLNSVTIV